MSRKIEKGTFVSKAVAGESAADAPKLNAFRFAVARLAVSMNWGPFLGVCVVRALLFGVC